MPINRYKIVRRGDVIAAVFGHSVKDAERQAMLKYGDDVKIRLDNSYKRSK